MVTRAIHGLDEGRRGSSLQAIKKWIVARYPVPENCSRYILIALKRGARPERKLFSHTTSNARWNVSTSAKAPRRKTKKPKGSKAKASKKVSSKKKVSTKKASKVVVKKSAKKAAPAKAAEKKKKAPKAAPEKAKAVRVPAGPVVEFPVARGNAALKDFVWQYQDDAGKFKNYDGEASDIVEGCYEEYIKNPNMMDVRAVKSGDWQYQVDFINLKQTNIQHANHKVRNIRRIENPNKKAAA